MKLKEALKIGMLVVMNNHMYTFDGRIHRQESGGSIGLELTGNIAQVFMIWWDCTLKSHLAESGILVRLMKRYVDDVLGGTVRCTLRGWKVSYKTRGNRG